MSVPFEKFHIDINDPASFTVLVSQPEQARKALNEGTLLSRTQEQMDKITVERFLFIEDAIREKLERERKP